MKIYKCIFCKYTNSDKHTMGKHYHMKHQNMIPKDMTGYRWFYYLLTGKDHRECAVCKSLTDFNEGSMKYSKFCNNPACKEVFRKQMENARIGKYGKVHLLNDPDMQKKMQAGRRIAGVYEWKDRSAKYNYLGSYEKDFLQMLDQKLNWKSSDLMWPSPCIFEYEYSGTKHFYMPDGFIPSLNLQIEIKDDGSAKNISPDSRAKDKIKDELMRTNATNFQYIKIVNKQYNEFLQLIRGE